MHRNMILSSLLTLLKINLSYSELFCETVHGYWNEKKGLKYIYVLLEFKHTKFFTSHEGYLLNTTLQVPGVGFSVAGLH